MSTPSTPAPETAEKIGDPDIGVLLIIDPELANEERGGIDAGGGPPPSPPARRRTGPGGGRELDPFWRFFILASMLLLSAAAGWLIGSAARDLLSQLERRRNPSA